MVYDGEPMYDDEEVVGRVGDVRVRIRGGDRPGEVAVLVRGTVETFIAYAEGPIERGARVLVITSRGNRAVDVVTWTE